MNPMQEVPTLVVKEDSKPDLVLNQSLAIIEYLDSIVPEPRAIPQEFPLRSQVMSMALDIATGIQPVQNLGVLQHVAKVAGDEHKMPWGKHWIERGLIALEAKAAKSQTRFLLTDSPSVAEACLIPQLYNARRFAVDVNQFPRLLEVEAQCEDLPAFKSAHPDAQPDANVV
jgi:maleylacetoacetate isomerase